MAAAVPVRHANKDMEEAHRLRTRRSCVTLGQLPPPSTG